MANSLLQSSQTQATTAPQFYSDYLSNLASQGQKDVQNAQYVGAQPLQEQAFTDVKNLGASYKPELTQAQSTLDSAAGAQSPLAAGARYLAQAAESPGAKAQEYMNPYMASAIQNVSDIAQRNIQQNLGPAATAAGVGAGQFGSQRGAQVLGQVNRQAQQDLESQMSNLFSTGYGQALQAATAQNQILGNLGATAGTQAAQEQQNLTNIGKEQGALAQTGQNLSLADINALSTLGGQQQTIAQNKELFPLTNLSTLASVLRGYNVPTTTTTTAEMSPLSAAGAIGSGVLGLLQAQKYDANGNPVQGSSYLDQLINQAKSWMGTDSTTNPYANTTVNDQSQDETSGSSGYWDENGNWVQQ